MRFGIEIFLLFMISAIRPAFAARGPERMAKGNTVSGTVRPKVALVLCGGGAKGAAHIGVLKVLEEVGIVPDMIIGTSMGGIVGGLYSIGYNASELDSMICHMDWDFLLSNNTLRRNSSFYAKQTDEKYLISIPFYTIRKGSASDGKDGGQDLSSLLPGGLIQGQNVMNMLNGLSVGYQDSLDFSNLPIPFACVATDLSTGREVILNHGSLPLSIRATMAIPGVFAPVDINGKVLCDGGMVNNFPADVAKAMGADIIIGVDIQSDLAGSGQLKSLPQIFSQIILLMGNERYMANKKLVDIYIKPDVNGFSTMSFSPEAVKTLIASGYAAADKKRPQLKALAKRLSGYVKGNVKKSFAKAHELKKNSYLLSGIEIDGIPESDGNWLLKKTELGINRVVSGNSISNAISIFMGTGAFKCVKYQLIKDKGKNSFKLVITFEKGPANEFAFNFRYDSEEAAALLLHLGIHTYDLKGSRLGITGRLSYNPYGRIDYSYVFKNLPQLNVSYLFKSNDMNIYKRDSSNFISFDMNRLEVSFSNAYLRNFDFTAGLRLEYYDFRNVISEEKSLYDSSSKTFLSYFASARMDTRDDSYFPSDGMKVDLYGDFFHTDFHGDFHKFMRFRAAVEPVISVSNRFTLLPSIMGSFIIGNDNKYTSFYNFAGGSQPGRYIDGQLPFVGINYAYAFASSLAVARLDMRERLGKNHYIYGIANYLRSVGNIADMFGENCTDSWGFGIRYAYDSKFGPMSVDCHWSDYTHKVGLYVNLGYYF